ncbi:11046_t:CDS:1 [Ambispora gerdemannii]|uniref:11046_t:CDS:1 n=1 Tax=Ambispora gerdemannii TaxID=144530 RepID=A0A9N9DZU1_9GLOM|nr:11046_t:CDS:1 [Ambispora gerdemannii]
MNTVRTPDESVELSFRNFSIELNDLQIIEDYVDATQWEHYVILGANTIKDIDLRYSKGFKEISINNPNYTPPLETKRLKASSEELPNLSQQIDLLYIQKIEDELSY